MINAGFSCQDFRYIIYTLKHQSRDEESPEDQRQKPKNAAIISVDIQNIIFTLLCLFSYKIWLSRPVRLGYRITSYYNYNTVITKHVLSHICLKMNSIQLVNYTI